jgi:hypothetical protein
MSPRDIAALSSRVLALAILAFCLSEFTATLALVLMSIGRMFSADGGFASVNAGEIFVGTLVFAISPGLRILAAWFLWTRAEWIASQLVPAPVTNTRWPRIRVVDIQTAAFSCVGLVFFLSGVRALCGYVSIFLEYSSYSENFSVWKLIHSEVFLASLASATLGAWLVLGSRGVVRIVRRLQRPAIDETSQDELATKSEI